MYAYTNTHAHTHTHTHMHARTHARTHTRTHTTHTCRTRSGSSPFRGGVIESVNAVRIPAGGQSISARHQISINAAAVNAAAISAAASMAVYSAANAQQ